MALTPATNRQIPDTAILDFYNKQTYLGNSYIVTTNLVATTTTETPLLIITNPASNFNQNGQSGNLSLFNSVRKLQCDTLEAGIVFRFYGNPTNVTAGSAFVPRNLRSGSSNVSKMTASINPTIAGNVDQVQTITAVADVSGSLNSKYFLIYSIDPIGSVKTFYVWFNINSVGVNPNIVNATGVEISAATNASASTLGGDIRTALGALTNDFTITGSGSGVIATNVNPGLAPAAADGTAATGFTFANTTPGVDNYGTLIAVFTPNLTEIDSSVLNILDPGSSLLVTVEAQSSSNAVAELSWYEI